MLPSLNLRKCAGVTAGRLNPFQRVWLAALACAALLDTAAAATVLTRTSAFDYEPASGLLTKEMVEPQVGSLCLVTAHQRDNLGRIHTSTTRPCNGSATQLSGGAVEAAGPGQGTLAWGQDRITTFTFSPDGRFTASTTNPEGHTESTLYDARLGVGTQHTGPNGLVTQWAYDAFGRKTLQKNADGTGVRWTYQYCASVSGGTDNSCPTVAGAAGAFSVTETPVKGPIDLGAQTTGGALGPYTKTYFDALSRTIRAETQGSDTAGASRLVFMDTEYDALGRVARKSRPYFQNDAAVWSSLSYDVLGRVIQTVEPTAAGLATSTMAYNGPSTTSTNALLEATTELRNIAGQVALVTDAEGGTLTKAYDPLGNLVRTTDAKGNVTSITYDTRGRRSALYDPDMGVWTYIYNVFGDLRQQTDTKQQVSTTTYDRLSRIKTRSEPGQGSTWYYDTQYANGSTCTKGMGKLCEVVTDTGVQRKHVYDALGRLQSTTTTLQTPSTPAVYTSVVSYSTDTGRVLDQTYPGGMQVRNEYSALGFQKVVRDLRTNQPFWTAGQSNAEGQWLTYTYGNNLVTTNDYFVDGKLNTTLAGANGGVQMLAHTYDLAGRLLTRGDFGTGVSSSYEYDKLGRLKKETRSGGSVIPAQVMAWTYDSIGNMTTRSEGGVMHTYNYPGSGVGSLRPHAVASVSGAVNGLTLPTYSYDGNGNLTSGAGRTVTWTAFDKVQRIDKGPARLDYWYDAEHERIKEEYRANGTVQRTTVYLNPGAGAGLYFEEESGAAVGGLKRKHYITAGGMSIGMAVFNGSTWAVQYWHRDHLGSVSTATNEAGAVLERLAYEPFGKRRVANGLTDVNGTLVPVSTDRGFTGHEHMDEVGLVNMNGRVYDAGLGRFLSADPFIQSPEVLQSYNRYSYVWNSPLNSTDPSGYFSLQEGWRDAWHNQTVQAIATIVIGKQFGPWAAAEYTAARVTYETGSVEQGLKAGVISYLTAKAFQKVGDWTEGHDVDKTYFLTEFHLQNIVGHALVGCASAAASGADCGQGAAGAALGSFVTPLAAGAGDFGFVIAAVAGGVGSKLAGGKFENGALTSAFGYLFNNNGGNQDDEFAEGTPAQKQMRKAHKLGNDIAAGSAAALETTYELAAGGALLGGARVANVAQKIASGHALEKHLVGVKSLAGDPLFKGLGIRTVRQLADHIEMVIKNPTEFKALNNGRSAYWHAPTSTIVVVNPGARDLGTVFQPLVSLGKQAYDKLR